MNIIGADEMGWEQILFKTDEVDALLRKGAF